MATELSNLQTIKSNLLAVLAAETAYQLANGPKPTYTLDGENYLWSEWREAVLRKVDMLNRLIQSEAGPFQLGMRLRG
ncbi:MAG: hypothetical protein K2R98_08565 [Gemmataceae bacterium]|nr:hypothetical protein [Gemmataceae bacterium]